MLYESMESNAKIAIGPKNLPGRSPKEFLVKVSLIPVVEWL